MSAETVEDIKVGFSQVIEEYLEMYFSLHCEGNIPPGLHSRVLAEVEQTLFNVTLKYSGGNRLKAAKILGINRNTLRRKMTSLGESNI